MRRLLISALLITFSALSFAQNIPNIWVQTGGSANAYTANISGFGTSYTNKIAFIKFHVTNTSASTINIAPVSGSSIGATPIRKWNGSSWVALSGGELKIDVIYRLTYDNTNSWFQLDKFGYPLNWGSSAQIPVTNSTGDSYSYGSNFTFNSTRNTLFVGDGSNTNTSSTASNLIIVGANNSVSGTGGGWSILAGENLTVSGSGGGDFGLLGLRNSITGGGGQLLYGQDNTSSTPDALVGGANAQTSGTALPGVAIGIGAASTAKVLANGSSVNISNNTSAQTVGYGVLAMHSVALGGTDHNIPVGADRSISLGGNALHMLATDTGTVYVDNLRIRHESGSGTRMLTVTSDGHVSNQAIPSGGTGSLSAGHIFVGNVSNVATDVALTGDGSMSSSGVLTITKLNGTSLAGLSTGLLKNTTGTGVPSIATAGTDYTLLNGTGYVKMSGTTASYNATIDNSDLTNSSITIAGNSTALGGSVTQDDITGLSSTGIIKRTGANTLATATSGTDYAPPTSGASILYGNGSGGFSNVTIGSGLSFSAGSLSSTSGTVATFSEMLAGTNNTHFGSPLSIRYVSQRVFNVEAYGAVHDGRYLTGGLTTTNGSATVSTSDGATPFTVSDVGKIILIPGAGASGATLKTTIATYNGTNSVILSTTASTSVTGAQSYYGTDDTAAIQAATDAAYNAGSGMVYFPIGFYTINGSLQTSVGGGNPNCQLYFQSHPSTTNTVVVKWIGEASVWSTQNTTAPQNGVILFSTLTSSSGTNPSVIGTVGATGNYQNFNFDEIVMENIGVRVWTNKGTSLPVVSGINFSLAGNMSMKRVYVQGEYDKTVSVNPTGSGFFGIWASSINNFCLGHLENVVVRGTFEYGIIYGEHLQATNTSVNSCYYGHTFLRSGHPVTGKILSQSNVTQIYIPSATTFLGLANNAGVALLNIQLETEYNVVGSWFDTQYLVRDFGNLAYGNVNFNASSIANMETLFSTLIATECVNLNVRKISSPLSNKVNSAGGAITDYGGNSHEAVLEIGSSTAATSAGDYIGAIATSANQSNANSLIGRIMWENRAATNKRAARIQAFTDGDVNNNTLRFGAQRASIDVEHFRLDGSVTNFVTLKPATGTTTLLPVQFTAGVDPTTNVSGGLWTNANNELKYSTSTTAASGGYFSLDRLTSTATSITLSGVHNTVLVTATGQTITLPTAVGKLGRIYTIKLTASGTGTVATTSSETIDGSTTYSLSAQYKYVSVQSDNANWNIISNN